MLIWTDENEAHLGEHEISRDEAEYVLRNPEGQDLSRTSDRPIAFGRTADGRRLAIIYERIDDVSVYPVTGYEVE